MMNERFMKLIKNQDGDKVNDKIEKRVSEPGYSHTVKTVETKISHVEKTV